MKMRNGFFFAKNDNRKVTKETYSGCLSLSSGVKSCSPVNANYVIFWDILCYNLAMMICQKCLIYRRPHSMLRLYIMVMRRSVRNPKTQ